MRKSLLILLSAELLVAAALGRLGHLDQPAALEWNQHPTVETRRAFEREKQMEEIGRLLCTGGVFMALAGATIFVYWLRRGDPLMLILKRFGTALVLFIILFPVLWVGSSVMGVGIVGSHAEASHYQGRYKEGEVGAGFVRDYGAIFFLGALGISVLASVTVAFSGVLPWCRRRSQPPKLPARMAAESGRASVRTDTLKMTQIYEGQTIGETGGPANGSQPIRSETHPTSSAAGSVADLCASRVALSFMKGLFLAAEPLPMRSYIFGMTLLSFIPSFLVAVLAVAFGPFSEVGPQFDEGAFGSPTSAALVIFFLFVVFSPIVETLLLSFGIAVTSLFTKRKAVLAVLSAILWAVLHSLVSPAWGLVVLWPFFVFSCAYLAWRPKSWFKAIWVALCIHAIQNVLPALAMLAHLSF